MKTKIRSNSTILIALILSFLLILSGCSETAPLNENTSNSVIPINPLSEPENSRKTNVKLYFQYGDERLLAGENRMVEVNEFEGAEKSLIDTLIKGPSADKAELSAVINPATKVLDIESQGEFLFVTLSQEFLEPFGEMNELTSQEQQTVQKRQRFLSVYSIVDTLLEQGTYSRINILVDDGNGARSLTMYEAGIEDNEDITEPFGYNYDIILTPENTMREILYDAEKKEWSSLYNYIAPKTAYGQDKPVRDDFINEMGTARFTISNPEVKTGIVSDDGSSAIVIINYEIKTQEYDTREMTDIPIKLVSENGIWKITYNTFKNKFISQ